MHGIDFIQDLAVVMLVAGLVGWACHRLGLSVVVGYLVAGVLIGPHTPPFSLVTDQDRIETLAQVGLIFLMFSIGMGLSLRKLRQLGLSLVLATFTGAVVMYNLTRVVGTSLGWSPVETAFLAAMLMVSSSAIISKILLETGATHEKTGQMAMGVSMLEDVVAIVMLTILNSLVSIGGAQSASLGMTLGLLSAFIALAGVGGLLLVPWLLKKMSPSAGKITARLTKGIFKFVTGNVARPAPDNMKIKVPTGTIGIRGTDVEVSVAPDNSGYIKLFEGKLRSPKRRRVWYSPWRPARW